MTEGSSVAPSRPASLSVPSAHETNNGSNHKLWCLVQGDSMPFMVTTSSNNRIFELQQLVYNQKDKGVLQDVNASDLALWKVSSFQKSE